MANFGNAIMGFFGGASSGGGGGTSTGINGLNGTTKIGLGGTITANTQIFGGGNDFVFTQFGNLVFEASNLLGIASIGNYGNYVRLLASDLSNSSILLVENEKISTRFNSTNFGLDVEYDFGGTIRKSILGDYDNLYSSNKLIVDDLNELIYTQNVNGNSGIFIQTNENFFGHSNATYYCGFRVESDQRITSKISGNVTEGLSLDFLNTRYTIGGIVNNINFIEVDDGNNNITFKSAGNITFTGATLQTSTAPLGAISYLVITLNGQQYYILCQQP